MQRRVHGLCTVVLSLMSLQVSVVALAEAQAPLDYRLLATNRTSTMEEELNEAAAAGFRLETVMGGETAFGGEEAVVVMSRRPDQIEAGRYQYRLLATNRTSTMEDEIRTAGASGYVYAGQTVFHSAFGGDEVAVILERDRDAAEAFGSWEYLLLATSRTSTMQEELQDAGVDGFVLLGMTVGRTAFGGKEVVAILRRQRQE